MSREFVLGWDYYGTMQCREAHYRSPHGPHCWETDATVFGPYLCMGYVPKAAPEYVGKHRATTQ